MHGATGAFAAAFTCAIPATPTGAMTSGAERHAGRFLTMRARAGVGPGGVEQVAGKLRIAVAAAAVSVSIVAATAAITRAEEGPSAGLGGGGGQLGPHDRYVIGTFNMGGYNRQLGRRGNEVPEALVREVLMRRPAVVAIQEACRDWMDYLDRRLPGYTVVFDPVRASRPGTPPGDPIQRLHQAARDGKPAQWEDPTGREGQMPKRWMQCKVPSWIPMSVDSPEMVKAAPPRAFGNAVLYRNDLGIEAIGAPYGRKGHGLGTDTVHVAEPGGDWRNLGIQREQREMLCVKSSARKLVACSLHLSAGTQHQDALLRAQEASQARWILRNRFPADYTVFVGGDFNASPTERPADFFYHTGYGNGAVGDLKEATSPCQNRIEPRFHARLGLYQCRGGVQTIAGRKIDYLFVSPRVRVNSSEAGPLTEDHRTLWAEVVA
ncbi:endonuclease/exonuclease/phosphatase family protein [Spirillospora sp. CA-142024]|uniref:endonuclease/exonuclease/phosphatase family protein n=1 Tax=Spirillospora sp. CA-142024 TaxID=3240036 RepID=UPI003D8F2DC7